MIWTIDTWVLATANHADDLAERVSAQGFLSHVLRKHYAAITDEVLKEYHRAAMGDRKNFAATWYAAMAKQRLTWFWPPEAQEATELRRLLTHGPLPSQIGRFDPSDIPFPVLAVRTADRHLISGDVGPGDYSPPLTQWLHEEYRVCFHEPAMKEPFHQARHECTRLDDS